MDPFRTHPTDAEVARIEAAEAARMKTKRTKDEQKGYEMSLWTRRLKKVVRFGIVAFVAYGIIYRFPC